MLYSSKGLAFLLSLGIALTISILFYFFERNMATLLLLFFIGFAVTFSGIYYALDRFIFREIEEIRAQMDILDIRADTAGADNEDSEVVKNPLEKIRIDVEAFANRKQAEIDQLKKLEAFRKDFIADVSHELKTPIFAAQGFVHTILDGTVMEKGVRKKFLKKAAKSLDGLDILVQDLLTLSHIETGQIKMHFDEIDLYALTEETFEQFKGKTNKKEISLRIEGPVRKVPVYADAQRIGQVMTNLISNAIKHSEDAGEVVVSFSIRKKSVITRVRDFGEGIPPEHINRIFERFYRVDKSRSREKGGTGLGLAIVKHILDGHRTRAEVESIPGKGSTFSFKLPREKSDENGNTEDKKD